MIPRRIFREYAALLSIFARLIDLSAVMLGGVVAYYWRFGNWNLPGKYQSAILVGILICAIVFPTYGMYQSWRGKSLFHQMRMLIFAWVSVITLLIVFAFLTKISASYSRQWLTMWSVSGMAFILLLRIFLGQALRVMRTKGWNHKKIVIIGAGKLGKYVAHNIADASWAGMDVVGFLDDSPELNRKVIEGRPVLGAISTLEEMFIENDKDRIDEVWIALPLRAEHRVKDVLYCLRNSTVTIRFIPDIFGFSLLNHTITEIAGIPVLDVSASPMVGVNRIVKAIEDRMIALVVLFLISPLLVLIAIGVKISSPGPILFKQRRHGWDGRFIKIYKFRSMIVHEEGDDKVTQACKNDRRVTKFGAFLRHTSFDELPQFFNVLQGRMSIVGPRPHAIAHNEEYKDQINAYMKRHKVKAGITGWAQVNGLRGDTDLRKRVKYDLYYIENWSLWLDLKIIFLTVFIGFTHQNAY